MSNVNDLKNMSNAIRALSIASIDKALIALDIFFKSFTLHILI